MLAGRNTRPSAGIADSQSAKTTGVGGEQRGYDGGKKVRGRKRPLLVDTEGLVLKAKVHSAKVPDQDGLTLLLKSAGAEISSIKHLWLDSGYQGRGMRWAEEVLGLSVELVRKPAKPVPEEVARIWARSGPRKARRWTGRGSHAAARISGVAEEVDGRADLLLVGPEQKDEQGLREAVRQRGSVCLRRDD